MVIYYILCIYTFIFIVTYIVYLLYVYVCMCVYGYNLGQIIWDKGADIIIIN